MTDYEYQKTLLLGAIIGASITILALHMTKPVTQHQLHPKQTLRWWIHTKVVML
jgi:hypothetical protein